MSKHVVGSICCFLAFLLLFIMMINGVSFGSSGKLAIFAMMGFPLMGVVLSFWNKRKITKWLFLLLHTSLFCIMVYLLALGFGMGEK